VKCSIFAYIVPCSPTYSGRFGGTCRYIFWVKKLLLLRAVCELGLFFDPEEGGNVFFRNVRDFNGLYGAGKEKLEFIIQRSPTNGGQAVA
jgi:hypothetical protein